MILHKLLPVLLFHLSRRFFSQVKFLLISFSFICWLFVCWLFCCFLCHGWLFPPPAQSGKNVRLSALPLFLQVVLSCLRSGRVPCCGRCLLKGYGWQSLHLQQFWCLQAEECPSVYKIFVLIAHTDSLFISITEDASSWGDKKYFLEAYEK